MTIKELFQRLWADIKTYLSSNYQPKGSYASSDHNHNSAYLGINAKASSASSADSVAWTNVSDRPTAVSSFTNDSGYITGAGSCNYANSAGSANDPNAVHRSGDETVGGTKTYSSDIYSTNSQHLWFRHLDGSNNGGMDGSLYLNYSNTTKNVYFNGDGYYINGGYYNGRSENAQYTYWLRTSSHADHLFHTEWDGSYFWTYVTAGDGGYRAVRVARSDSSGYADTSGNTDTLDGYHENAFLRSRGGTSASGEGTLWSQIGIKEYYNALPDGLSGIYGYGETISIPGANCRFDIYCSHQSSAGNGLYYRSGWDYDRRDWRCFIDSANIGSQSVNHATYAARSSGDGAFFISGYQIYVG